MDLPSELIAEIVNKMSVDEMLNSRLVCHQFKESIDKCCDLFFAKAVSEYASDPLTVDLYRMTPVHYALIKYATVWKVFKCTMVVDMRSRVERNEDVPSQF